MEGLGARLPCDRSQEVKKRGRLWSGRVMNPTKSFLVLSSNTAGTCYRGWFQAQALYKRVIGELRLIAMGTGFSFHYCLLRAQLKLGEMAWNHYQRRNITQTNKKKNYMKIRVYLLHYLQSYGAEDWTKGEPCAFTAFILPNAWNKLHTPQYGFQCTLQNEKLIDK